jgi:hypothetical protein
VRAVRIPTNTQMVARATLLCIIDSIRLLAGYQHVPMISVLLYRSLEHEKALQEQLRGEDTLCLVVSKNLSNNERERENGEG